MKRFCVLIFAALLLLCSCTGGTQQETEENVEVTADVDILLSASGFEKLYDENIGGTWIYKDGINSGFFARILVYDDGETSLRVICTESESFECGAETYEITNGDISADQKMLDALRSAANGADCRVGGREITATERAALKSVTDLYDGSYSGSYAGDTERAKPSPDTDADGNALFDCELFSVKYPAEFECIYEDGALTVTSKTDKLQTAAVKRADTQFSSSLSDKDAVEKSVIDQGGKLISEVAEIMIDGRTAYKYKYEKDGIYITQYYVDGGDKTYIASAGTYVISDILPDIIISTLHIK